MIDNTNETTISYFSGHAQNPGEEGATQFINHFKGIFGSDYTYRVGTKGGEDANGTMIEVSGGSKNTITHVGNEIQRTPIISDNKVLVATPVSYTNINNDDSKLSNVDVSIGFSNGGIAALKNASENIRLYGNDRSQNVILLDSQLSASGYVGSKDNYSFTYLKDRDIETLRSSNLTIHYVEGHSLNEAIPGPAQNFSKAGLPIILERHTGVSWNHALVEGYGTGARWNNGFEEESQYNNYVVKSLVNGDSIPNFKIDDQEQHFISYICIDPTRSNYPDSWGVVTSDMLKNLEYDYDTGTWSYPIGNRISTPVLLNDSSLIKNPTANSAKTLSDIYLVNDLVSDIRSGIVSSPSLSGDNYSNSLKNVNNEENVFNKSGYKCVDSFLKESNSLADKLLTCMNGIITIANKYAEADGDFAKMSDGLEFSDSNMESVLSNICSSLSFDRDVVKMPSPFTNTDSEFKNNGPFTLNGLRTSFNNIDASLTQNAGDLGSINDIINTVKDSFGIGKELDSSVWSAVGNILDNYSTVVDTVTNEMTGYLIEYEKIITRLQNQMGGYTSLDYSRVDVLQREISCLRSEISDLNSKMHETIEVPYSYRDEYGILRTGSTTEYKYSAGQRSTWDNQIKVYEQEIQEFQKEIDATSVFFNNYLPNAQRQLDALYSTCYNNIYSSVSSLQIIPSIS